MTERVIEILSTTLAVARLTRQFLVRVDNNPVVMAHACALLTSAPEGEQAGEGDRVHVMDDLATADPDYAQRGELVRGAGDVGLAVVGDLGEHYLGVVGLPYLRVHPFHGEQLP
jgi:hypothetical protein